MRCQLSSGSRFLFSWMLKAMDGPGSGQGLGNLIFSAASSSESFLLLPGNSRCHGVRLICRLVTRRYDAQAASPMYARCCAGV